MGRNHKSQRRQPEKIKQSTQVKEVVENKDTNSNEVKPFESHKHEAKLHDTIEDLEKHLESLTHKRSQLEEERYETKKIQDTIQESSEKLETVYKETRVLTLIIRALKGKSYAEQKSILEQKQASLEAYPDIHSLVQETLAKRQLTKEQQEWLEKVSEKMEDSGSDGDDDLGSHESMNYDQNNHPAESSDPSDHPQETLFLIEECKKILQDNAKFMEEVRQSLKTLLSQYDLEIRWYVLSSTIPFTKIESIEDYKIKSSELQKKIKEQNDHQSSNEEIYIEDNQFKAIQHRHNYAVFRNTILDKETYQATLAFLACAIESQNNPRETEEKRNREEKHIRDLQWAKTKREIPEPFDYVYELYEVKKSIIDEHESQNEEELEKSINLLADAIASQHSTKQQLTTKYNQFIKTYDIHEDTNENAPGFEEADALYQALIENADSQTQSTKENVQSKLDKAKSLKEGISFYKGAIELKNSSIKKDELDKFIQAIKSKVSNEHPYFIKSTNLYELLKRENELHKSLNSTTKSQKKHESCRQQLVKYIATMSVSERKWNNRYKKVYNSLRNDFKNKTANYIEPDIYNFKCDIETSSICKAMIDFYDSLNDIFYNKIKEIKTQNQEKLNYMQEDINMHKERLQKIDSIDDNSTALDEQIKNIQAKIENKRNSLKKSPDAQTATSKWASSSSMDVFRLPERTKIPTFMERRIKSYRERYQKALGEQLDLSTAVERVKAITERYSLRCQDTAIAVDIHIRKTFNTTPDKLYKDKQGNVHWFDEHENINWFDEDGKANHLDTKSQAGLKKLQELKKLEYDYWGNKREDGKKVKVYTDVYLEGYPSTAVFGIKREGFGKKTAMPFGGTGELKSLLKLGPDTMNLNIILSKAEISEEAQDTLEITKITVDKNIISNALEDQILYYTRAIVKISANTDNKASVRTIADSHSKYIPLEHPEDPNTYDPRYEMAGIALIDFDDLIRKVQNSTNHSISQRDILNAIIPYLHDLGATEYSSRRVQDLIKNQSLYEFRFASSYWQKFTKNIGEYLQQIPKTTPSANINQLVANMVQPVN